MLDRSILTHKHDHTTGGATTSALALLLVASAGLIATPSHALAESIATAYAISIIESNEAKVQNLRFTCEHSSGKVISKGTSFRIGSLDFGTMRATVALDAVSMRYLIRTKLAQSAEAFGNGGQILQGKSFVERQYSNDRKTWRIWSRADQDPITTSDADDWSHRIRAEEIISKAMEEAALADGGGPIAQYGSQIGLGWATPFVCVPGEPTVKFSAFLQAKSKNPNYSVEVESPAEDSWRIWVGTPQSVENSAGYLFHYNPVLGHLVSIDLGPRDKVGLENPLPYWRVTLDYTADSDFVPREVVYLQHSEGGQAGKWKYTDVSTNVAEANDHYTLMFPSGVEVMDYVNKQLYVVGSGNQDDEIAARKFRERVNREKRSE